jgi:hypothetical protein
VAIESILLVYLVPPGEAPTPIRPENRQVTQMISAMLRLTRKPLWEFTQGPRSPKRCPDNHYQQEVIIPTETRPLHHDAVLSWMLL